MTAVEPSTLSFLLALGNALFALILGLQFIKDRSIRGFGAWVLAFWGLSIHYSLRLLQDLFTFNFPAAVFSQVGLVFAFGCLYYGVLRFFKHNIQRVNFLIFSLCYVLITALFYARGNILFPRAISLLFAGVFTVLSAGLLVRQTSPGRNTTSLFLSLTFFTQGLFMLVHGMLRFVIPSTPTFIDEALLEQLAFLVSFSGSTLWLISFIFMFNRRLNLQTTERQLIYDLTINTIPDAVFITRLDDGKFFKINKGFTSLSGYTEEDVFGMSTNDTNIWFNSEDRQKLVTLLKNNKPVENMVFTFRRKNGRPLSGLMTARTIKLGDEWHIFYVVRDITAQKKVEEKLRENEQKYRFLTENSGDVIWHINKSYRIDYISTVDERIRGYKRKEVIGQPIWNIFNPEGIQLIRQKIDHHQAVEQVGNSMKSTRFEVEQRCKDGRWIWTEITAAPHYDRNNNLIGYHGISRDISAEKHLREQLQHLAFIDDLTNVPNRRYFLEMAENELARAKRYQHPLSIVLIDFDDLKKVNDTYGHFAGDRALIGFVQIVRNIIRETDIIGRFGGDEFLLLLPETEIELAYQVMERICEALAESPIAYQNEQFFITISAGIASLEKPTDTLENLVNTADQALYHAKEDDSVGIFYNKPPTGEVQP